MLLKLIFAYACDDSPGALPELDPLRLVEAMSDTVGGRSWIAVTFIPYSDE